MAQISPALRSLELIGCRHGLLSYAACANGICRYPSLRPASACHPARLSRHNGAAVPSPGRRYIYMTLPLRSTADDSPQQEASISGTPDSNDAVPSQSFLTQAIEPWYLQDASTAELVTPPESMQERQRLPELPEDAPPLLQPLLQQISVDLGLDYLSLLDLRSMDPPPALGANLLMIIGTARSEKHLHVSADRLCRWLRSKHGLRPNADGLLGRNELKVKLRRQARRAKLLGSSREEDEESVRSGWVCVDIGVVDADGRHLEQQSFEFGGFGSHDEGQRIVVQMLTEERRKEVDLETLWNGFLQKNIQKRLHNDSIARASDSTAQSATPVSNPVSKPALSAFESDVKISGTASGTREYHTSRQLRSSTQLGIPDEPEAPHNTSLQGLWIRVKGAIIAHDDAFSLQSCIDENCAGSESDGKRYILQKCIQFLKACSRDEAMNHLGRLKHSKHTTTFMRIIEEVTGPVPTAQQWEARLWLYCFGCQSGNPSYSREGLLSLVHEVQLSGIRLSTPSANLLLRTILTQQTPADPAMAATSDQMAEASDMIRALHDQGLPVLTEEVFVILQETFGPSEAASPSKGVVKEETFGLASIPLPPLQRRVHIAMSSVDLPPLTDESRMRIMDVYSQGQHWYAFWNMWSWPLRRMSMNTADMYVYMFRKVAQLGLARTCSAVLHTWVPDLRRADPPVELRDELARAIQSCLLVIEPELPHTYDQAGRSSVSQAWGDLWKSCARGLSGPGG